MGNKDSRTDTSSGSVSGNQTVIITLSTVLSVVGVILVIILAYLCARGRRKRTPLFNRGITPIGDDEIASWKINRTSEKPEDRYTRRPVRTPNTSTSTRRAPSVIQYQNDGRPSMDIISPRSFINDKYSFDLPRAPGAVLARAPNARSGLTDETVPGDDPFLPSPKRSPSKLHKSPADSPTRTRGSRSNSIKSFADHWRGSFEVSPRISNDSRRGHSRIYSSSSIPPRLSLGDHEQFTGLSPPPSRRKDSTIGQAIG
ncbi:hypothetical protein F4778DRAFT_84033 [Xylariomycetidae sp. FL2044]|nr:hypothetical protein F4778DRAFT_84033 [Xylariomycetidae sp. FL2044]